MKLSVFAAAIAAGLGLAGSAMGDLAHPVRIAANIAGHTGYWDMPADALPGSLPNNDPWLWEMTTPAAIIDSQNGQVLAMVKWVRLEIQADPVVNLNFSVQAGGADTDFTISSALLSFAGINMAEGRATAGITLTDSDSLGNGATITGLQPGGKIYTAHYNGFVPGGSTFANLVSGFSVGSFSSQTQSEALPPGVGTFIPIAGTVSDMSSQFKFRLTAEDQASGTSTFIVREAVPAPGGAAVLALAGLSVVRRRR